MKETKERENLNLQDQIHDLSKTVRPKQIAETQTQGVLTAEKLKGLIKHEESSKEALLDQFKTVEVELNADIMRATENYERWLMQAEDYHNELWRVTLERAHADDVVKANSKALEALKKEKLEQEALDGQIELSMELLSEAMDYFSHSKEHIHFNVILTQSSFCDVLKQLRKSTFEAIEAEKNFEFQATKDPRELLPYSRKS